LQERIESSKTLAEQKAELDGELKQKQKALSGFVSKYEDEIKKYEQKIKAKTDELTAIRQQVEDSRIPGQGGSEFDSEKQKILHNLEKLESDRVSGGIGRHSYEFWKKKYTSELKVLDIDTKTIKAGGDVQKPGGAEETATQQGDYVHGKELTPEEELRKKWFDGKIGIVEYEKRLKKLSKI